MTYAEFVQIMQQLLVMTDVYGQQMFNALIGTIITFAENMIYREPTFDFLSTRTSDLTQTTMTGVRSVSIPSRFLVVENVNLITPSGANPQIPGYERVPLWRTSRAWIDATWPMESLTKAPTPFETLWAIFSEEESADEGAYVIPNNIIIAPTPNDQYTVEYLGIFQPAALSATNMRSFLSTYFPDLFIAAAMFFACGSLKKSYGAQADNPKEAVSWKMVYDEIKAGVAVQSARQKSMVDGYSPYPPTPPNPAALAAMAAQHAAQMPGP